MANPFQFLQEVRQEAGKVTWPNRRETLITTILVVVMCVFASLFLFAADQGIHLLITFVLSLGH
jgi:preprotein translocase subunit SecE